VCVPQYLKLYKVAEAEWKYLDVNEHWQQMKNIMMETAQVTCGLSKGQCRRKETRWWNEEVAEAVIEKKVKYGNCVSIHVVALTQGTVTRFI